MLPEILPPQDLAELNGEITSLGGHKFTVRCGDASVTCDLGQMPFIWKDGPLHWSNPSRLEKGDRVMLCGVLGEDGTFVDLQKVWVDEGQC